MPFCLLRFHHFGNICGIKLEIAEVLLVSVSSESFSLGYSLSGILSGVQSNYHPIHLADIQRSYLISFQV